MDSLISLPPSSQFTASKSPQQAPPVEFGIPYGQCQAEERSEDRPSGSKPDYILQCNPGLEMYFLNSDQARDTQKEDCPQKPGQPVTLTNKGPKSVLELQQLGTQPKKIGNEEAWNFIYT